MNEHEELRKQLENLRDKPAGQGARMFRLESKVRWQNETDHKTFIVLVKESADYVVLVASNAKDLGDGCDDYLKWWDDVCEQQHEEARPVWWWDEGQGAFWAINASAVALSKANGGI